MVNHDGRNGVALDPLVWSAGARPKRRRPLYAIRDRAFLPGPPGLGLGVVTVPSSVIFVDDIAHWPYTPVFWLNGLPFLVPCIGPLGGCGPWCWWYFLCGVTHSL